MMIFGVCFVLYLIFILYKCVLYVICPIYVNNYNAHMCCCKYCTTIIIFNYCNLDLQEPTEKHFCDVGILGK